MQSIIDWTSVDLIIKNALAEDIHEGDVTSQAMQVDLLAEAEIVAKQSGILAGCDIAKRVFSHYDGSLEIHNYKVDGDKIKAGDVILKIKGKGQSILTAERTALNLLGRMSGVATMTSQFVDKVAGTKCSILDTRKTLPNFRILDKYAVTCGGGKNHRMGLYDMILIKENHIRWAGGLEKALESALDYAKPKKLDIEIEVTNLDEYKRAVQYPIKMIMLDHFTLDELKTAVSIEHGNILLEASGDVNINTVADIAKTGIDVVSIGAITHSAPNFDLSLLFHES